MITIDNINLHHLYYFWVVANEGSVTAASQRLGLAQPSVSSQVRKLETSIGTNLFERSGRGKVLSEYGQEVYQYADSIFDAAQHLVDFLNGQHSQRKESLTIGVPDIMPKLVAYRFIKPVCDENSSSEVICHASRFEDLLTDLAVNRFDLVLSHTPVASHVKIRAFNHKLGECGLTFFALPDVAAELRGAFPRSLESAQFLLPVSGTEMRRSLDQWFDSIGIKPNISGQIYDSALLKEFGGAGLGVFAMPSVIENEVCSQYGVEAIGRATEVREMFYAITTQKRIHHPGVKAIVESARKHLLVA